MEGAPGPGERRRVAIVAVHGIGQQSPGSSARALAAMLLRVRTPDGQAPYRGFHETPLQIATDPLRVTPPGEKVRSSRWRERSDALTSFLRTRVDDSGLYAAEYEFMRAQLANYRSSGEPYSTTRIEGSRQATEDTPATDVHIHEVFWADLSRVGSGSLRLLGAFYQLLFDIAHLGKVAVDHAALRYREIRGWTPFWYTHALTVRLFTVFVPAAWAVMLATSLTLVLVSLETPNKERALSILGGVTVFGTLWTSFRRARASGIAWFLVPLLAITTAYLVGKMVEVLPERRIDQVLVISWTTISLIAVIWLFRRYQQVRPGAAFGGALTAVLTLGASLAWVPWGSSSQAILGRVLDVFVVETGLTVLLWYVIYGVGVFAAVAGLLVVRRMSGADALFARRTLWTAMSTLAIGASAVLVFTFILWSGILASSRSMLDELGLEHIRFRLPGFTMGELDADRLPQYLSQILMGTAGAGYPLLLWCILGILLVAVIVLWPPFATEINPRDDRGADSDRMGRDLTDGIRVLAMAAVVLFFATFILQPGVSMTHWAQELWGVFPASTVILERLHQRGDEWITWSGGLIGASGLGLLALRGRLGPLIDTALDVDNYLREHPRDRTPRARIAERYASLLRHINTWRDAEGRPYDRVVIVAHSQGTVITADLLGFARMERAANPDLFPLLDNGEPALMLFTMGSPLRQVYAPAFPFLFEWMQTNSTWGQARECKVGAPPSAGDGGRGELPERTHGMHRVSGMALADDAAPFPPYFGLRKWVNAYRSGDYVGRALWRDALHNDTMYRCCPDRGEAFPEGTVFVSEDAGGTRRELCIGVGAHTRYWDATARAIGVEVDLLVTR